MCYSFSSHHPPEQRLEAFKALLVTVVKVVTSLLPRRKPSNLLGLGSQNDSKQLGASNDAAADDTDE